MFGDSTRIHSAGRLLPEPPLLGGQLGPVLLLCQEDAKARAPRGMMRWCNVVACWMNPPSTAPLARPKKDTNPNLVGH